MENSSRAMRSTTNNTRVFDGQASAGRGLLPGRGGLIRGAVLLPLALALGAAAGCRGARNKPPPEAAAHPARPADFSVPLPEAPAAGTLPDPAAVAAPPGPPAGTLRVHLDAEPQHLNPLAEDDASVHAVTAGMIYQTLLDCSDGTYRPGLAESWDVSDDGMRIAVTLRRGVRWHDHHAFGVMDVLSTIEPLLRSGGEATMARADLADVAAVELVTERTVRLVLRRPSDLALRALCDLPILPDHLIQGVRPEASPIAKQPVGTGPFRFAGWERGKRIRLVRAPEGFGPAPGVEEIVFDVEPDAVHALNRTRRGDLDVLPHVLDVHYPDQVEPATLHGTTALYKLAPDRYSFLVANHRHLPLADPRFRRAIALLWDRQRFAHELHKDLARPIGGPTFGGEAAPAPAFDHKRAAAMLEDAGYRDTNADGVRDRDGRAIRLTMLVTAGSKPLAVESRAFVLEMRRAGILVDAVQADGPTILARLRHGEFDLAPMVWEGHPDEDPSALFGPDGPFNFSGYRSSALDEMLDDLRRAPGIAARRPILGRIAELLATDQPVIFLYRYDVPALVSTRVHGLAAVGDRLDFRRVWLDP
jgi:peptide/nickel transport system substrate-binding protein